MHACMQQPPPQLTTREAAVEWCSRAAVSSISTAKVLSPAQMRSWAPMRVKMRSTGASSAEQQGT
jgi:hypothetical protein